MPTTVGEGRCVKDGPFANLNLLYYDTAFKRHCLSRGFPNETMVSRNISRRVKPSAISEVLDETDYFLFLLRLENGPHAAIPTTIRGDFSTFTAPNGELPFLNAR